VILTRAPLRITLGGGGTDLSPYVEEHGAFFITAAIDKYVHVALNPIYEDRYLLRYSDHESVSHIRAIQHPIIRTAFSIYEVAPGIELTSFADAPAGTGLGSSAAFTCALLQALATWYGDPAPTPMVLAPTPRTSRRRSSVVLSASRTSSPRLTLALTPSPSTPKGAAQMMAPRNREGRSTKRWQSQSGPRQHRS